MAVAEFQETLSVTAEEVRLMNAYWRAANYLSVRQIYLYGGGCLGVLKFHESDDNPVKSIGGVAGDNVC